MEILITVIKIAVVMGVMLGAVAYIVLGRTESCRGDSKPHRTEPRRLAGIASAVSRCRETCDEGRYRSGESE